MNIPGYTYVTHKLIDRPWGPECRYTVRDADGKLLDDVAAIPAMSVTEDALVDIISARLALITGPLPQPEEDPGIGGDV